MAFSQRLNNVKNAYPNEEIVLYKTEGTEMCDDYYKLWREMIDSAIQSKDTLKDFHMLTVIEAAETFVDTELEERDNKCNNSLCYIKSDPVRKKIKH